MYGACLPPPCYPPAPLQTLSPMSTSTALWTFFRSPDSAPDATPGAPLKTLPECMYGGHMLPPCYPPAPLQASSPTSTSKTLQSKLRSQDSAPDATPIAPLETLLDCRYGGRMLPPCYPPAPLQTLSPMSTSKTLQSKLRRPGSAQYATPDAPLKTLLECRYGGRMLSPMLPSCTPVEFVADVVFEDFVHFFLEAGFHPKCYRRGENLLKMQAQPLPTCYPPAPCRVYRVQSHVHCHVHCDVHCHVHRHLHCRCLALRRCPASRRCPALRRCHASATTTCNATPLPPHGSAPSFATPLSIQRSFRPFRTGPAAPPPHAAVLCRCGAGRFPDSRAQHLQGRRLAPRRCRRPPQRRLQPASQVAAPPPFLSPAALSSPRI